jgi:hypothetical protein
MMTDYDYSSKPRELKIPRAVYLVSRIDDQELSLDYWVPVTASIAQYDLHQCDSRDLNPGYQIGNLMS